MSEDLTQRRGDAEATSMEMRGWLVHSQERRYLVLHHFRYALHRECFVGRLGKLRNVRRLWKWAKRQPDPPVQAEPAAPVRSASALLMMGPADAVRDIIPFLRAEDLWPRGRNEALRVTDGVTDLANACVPIFRRNEISIRLPPAAELDSGAGEMMREILRQAQLSAGIPVGYIQSIVPQSIVDRYTRFIRRRLNDVIDRRPAEPIEVPAAEPTAREQRCPLCRGSGIQERGTVSGMGYEIACDCKLGRGNSDLCVIVNGRARRRMGSGHHRRRGNVGGMDRRPGRTVATQEQVLALLGWTGGRNLGFTRDGG